MRRDCRQPHVTRPPRELVPPAFMLLIESCHVSSRKGVLHRGSHTVSPSGHDLGNGQEGRVLHGSGMAAERAAASGTQQTTSPPGSFGLKETF